MGVDWGRAGQQGGIAAAERPVWRLACGGAGQQGGAPRPPAALSDQAWSAAGGGAGRLSGFFTSDLYNFTYINLIKPTESGQSNGIWR